MHARHRAGVNLCFEADARRLKVQLLAPSTLLSLCHAPPRQVPIPQFESFPRHAPLPGLALHLPAPAEPHFVI